MLAEELNGASVLRSYRYGADNGSGLDQISLSSGGSSYYFDLDGTGSNSAVNDVLENALVFATALGIEIID